MTLHSEDLLDVRKRKLLSLLARQQVGHLHSVLDLPTVEVQVAQTHNVLLRHLVHGLAQELLVGVDSAREEGLPDGGAAVAVQVGVLEGHVDTTLKGRVHVLDAVGGEEEDTLVVLEHAEEDADDAVAVHVGGGTGLEEDVALIEQEDGVPVRDHGEDLAEVALELVRLGAEVASAHDVEGRLHLLRDRLGSERLADAGSTGEEHDDTLALARDDIVEGVLELDLALREGEDELLVVLLEDERVKGVVVELNLTDKVDEELHPPAVAQRIAADGGRCHENLLIVEGCNGGTVIIRASVAVVVLAVTGDAAAAGAVRVVAIAEGTGVDLVVWVRLLPASGVNDDARRYGLGAGLGAVHGGVVEGHALVSLVVVAAEALEGAAALREDGLDDLWLLVELDGVAGELEEGPGADEFRDHEVGAHPSQGETVPVDQLAVELVRAAALRHAEVAALELDGDGLSVLHSEDDITGDEERPQVLPGDGLVVHVVLSEGDDGTELLMENAVEELEVLLCEFVMVVRLELRGELVPAVDEALEWCVED